MGFYNEQRPTGSDDTSKPGCMDVIVITRLVLVMLFWPMAGIMAVVIGVGIALYLYAIQPVLAFIPVVVGAIAVYLIARWDQRRSTPEEFRND